MTRKILLEQAYKLKEVYEGGYLCHVCAGHRLNKLGRAISHVVRALYPRQTTFISPVYRPDIQYFDAFRFVAVRKKLIREIIAALEDITEEEIRAAYAQRTINNLKK